MTAYADYLLEAYRNDPGWEAGHRDWIKRFAISGAVLDAGAGLGHLALACAGFGYRVVGVERDIDLVLAGRTKLGFDKAIQGDVCALPFRSGAFDWVLSNQVLEHVGCPMLLLEEALRVLKPGGKFLLTTPNRRTHFATRTPRHFVAALRGQRRSDPTHVKEFTPGEVRSMLLGVGFAVQYMEAIGRLSRHIWTRPWAGGVLVVSRKP